MSFYDDHKELVDQVAHAAAGFAVGALLHLIMPAIVALVIVTAIGYLRELWQHDWTPDEMGPGSYMDLAFIFGGGLLGVVV